MSQDLLLLSLGSNQGNRLEILHQALGQLVKYLGNMTGLSPVYESEPVDVQNHPPYLNLMVGFACDMPANEVLRITQDIEKQAGRSSKGDLSPRCLDIDIVLYGQQQWEKSDLIIPHASMPVRRFVLVPLQDVCPFFRHPVSRATVEEMLNTCGDFSWVRKHSFVGYHHFNQSSK